jgi:tetratricopeptide (TPR) repeat protein
MTDKLPASITKLVRQAEAFFNEGKMNQAQALSNKVIEAIPNNAVGYKLRSMVACKLCKFDQEAKDLEIAVKLAPEIAEFKTLLGLAYINLNQHEKALEILTQSLEQQPNAQRALLNMGFTYYELGDFTNAEAYYHRAIAVNPDWPRGHFNLSLLYLTQAKYAQGWAEYEWRLKMPELRHLVRNFRASRWQGEDLRFKTLLLYCEQGFGDIFQFARFLSKIKQPHNQIIIEAYAPIVPILKSLPWVDIVIEQGAPLPPFDYYASILSLPHVTKTYTELPETVPYFFSDKTEKKYWQEKLKAFPGKKIGICWAGKPTNKLNPRRSCPLEPLLKACDIEGIQVVNLKKDPVPADKLTLVKYNVLDFTDELHNFAQTAALMDALDLIVTIDTGIAHLAGCMGQPVWALLSAIPEWRYLLLPDSGAWYPSMRLIRQPTRGDWDSVFAQLREDLLQWK